ncbi:unnamed protein product, partial [Mesorhabditis spiculigera]
MLSIFLILLMGLAPAVLGSYNCVNVAGRVGCLGHPNRAADVKIQLWDSDALMDRHPLNHDDFIAQTWTNKHGEFGVDGCADDPDIFSGIFGENQPDPYLKIYHKCNSVENEMKRIDLKYWFEPKKQQFDGILYLNTKHNQSLVDIVLA